MHLETRSPLVTLEESSMRNIDPQDPKDLGLMWSIFSKTSAVMENGKRLENLSWRLWNRETLRCTSSKPRSILSSKDCCTISPPSAMPELSTSVDSTSSSDSDVHAVSSEDTERASRSHASDHHTPQMAAERHFTPMDLQNLVHSINEKQELKQPMVINMQKSEPLPPAATAIPQRDARSSSPRPVQVESSTSTVATDLNSPEFTSSSNTSVSSAESTHSVVRGFTPGTGITSYTSKSHLGPAPTPILKTSSSCKAAAEKKRSGMFMLGSSSVEDESSLRNNMSPRYTPCKGFQDSKRPSPAKKQTSFKEEVIIHKSNQHDDASAVVDKSDEEGDDTEVSESAIDDDDAWEDDDVMSESQSKLNDQGLKFPRVDSKVNLTSRRSAITLNLEEERSRGRFNSTNSRSSPTLRRSRTSTPNGPSMPASPEEDAGAHMKAAGFKYSKPVNLASPMPQQQAPNPLQSPRSTRRAMLAGELSESLRKHMLHERQQKNPLGGAGLLKRAHTSSDVKTMSQLPELAEVNHKNPETTVPLRGPRNLDWNHYFNHSLGEYNEAGW
ncbi:MAG: hypothetical protein M1828_001792 [Chrysothrix sp. TS-e1954]|nr:MAG: hypothetical protein M1828_001792 [Chrysothrix sp. TS-e1954]